MSDLLNTISTDVVRAQVVAGQVLLLANDTLMLAIYIYLSFNLSPGLTLVAAAAGAAVLVGSFPLRRRAHRFGIAVGIQNQSQVRVLTDFLGGIKAAKCLGAEGAFVEEFNAAIFETQSIFLAYGRMRANASAFGQSGGVAVLALLAFLAKTMLNLSFASFGGFVIVMLRLVPRISGIQGSVQEILSNVSAFATIEELRKQLVAAAEPARSNRGAPLPLSTIALEGVSFAYGSATDHLALKEINLLLPVGSATALIGRSGSGKSTTADVLAALIWPTSGRVLLDDVALDATTGPAWRTRVAYVSQEGLLLNRTIAENLALGRVDIPTRELMWAALRSAGAEEFVLQLAQGLDSPVGERGLKLSGGERQRILLARALLGEPTLLILDEATSALDWRNQQNVAEAIRRLKGKTTVVIIAHSMPLVAVADQIVELSEGRVVARGDFVAVAAHPESVLNAMNPQ